MLSQEHRDRLDFLSNQLTHQSVEALRAVRAELARLERMNAAQRKTLAEFAERNNWDVSQGDSEKTIWLWNSHPWEEAQAALDYQGEEGV